MAATIFCNADWCCGHLHVYVNYFYQIHYKQETRIHGVDNVTVDLLIL
jgi:hypothetical protein